MMHAKRAAARLEVAILVATIHCSRPTHAEGASTDASIPEASAQAVNENAADGSASSSRPDAGEPPRTPGAHVIFLPYMERGDTPAPQDGIAPGEPPGALFPAGTVYLARSEGDGEYVVEWDLARGVVRRRLELNVPPANNNLRIRRVGDVLHIFAWEYNEDARYVRVTSKLEQELTWPLGQASAFGPGAIAGDAGWTLLLADVRLPGTPPSDAGGYFAFSFDASGAFIARRKLAAQVPFDPLFNDANSAVVDGHGFVALPSSEDDSIRLVRLDRRLNLEGDFRVRTPLLDGGARPVFSALFGSGDHLDIAWLFPSAISELAASGQSLRRTMPCESDFPISGVIDELWLAGEHVALRGDNREEWLEWSDASTRPAPGPPCPSSAL